MHHVNLMPLDNRAHLAEASQRFSHSRVFDHVHRKSARANFVEPWPFAKRQHHRINLIAIRAIAMRGDD
jgi:hypothetical protein